MKKELTKHKFAYLILFLGLLAGTIGFMVVWPNRWWQRYIVIGMSGFYMMWGIFTHFQSEHISKKVVAEYISVSLLAGFLLFLLTI
jgi:hypothetical protein